MDLEAAPGDAARFTVEIFNQGSVTANSLSVIDYVDLADNPDGTTGGDAALSYTWSLSGDDGVVALSGALAPGERVSVPVTLTVSLSASGTLENYAEISVDDGDDVDSVPDAVNGNDTLIDDVLDNSGGDEDDHDIATVLMPPSTLALVTSVRTYQSSAGVVLEWQTASEAGTLGFLPYRFAPGRGEWVALSGALLPALESAPGGSRYRFLDRDAPADTGLTYLLVELEADGGRTRHGPYQVWPAGSGPAPEEGFEVRRRELSQRALERLRSARGGEGRIGTIQASSESYAAVRVEVTSSGVQRVDAAWIASLLGLSSEQVKSDLAAGQLRLEHHGEEVDWWSEEDSALYFYGVAPTGSYAPKSAYLLEQQPGTLAGTTDGLSPAPAPGGAFWHTERFEENLFAATATISDPGEEFWFWSAHSAESPGASSRSFDFELPACSAWVRQPSSCACRRRPPRWSPLSITGSRSSSTARRSAARSGTERACTRRASSSTRRCSCRAPTA